MGDALHCRALVALGFGSLLFWQASAARTPASARSSDAPVEWVDAVTGHRIVRLSTEPNTRSLYFHQNSITPDGRLLITSSPRGITTIDLVTRKNQIIVSGAFEPLFVGRKTGRVYFTKVRESASDQAPKEILTVPAIGGRPKVVAKIAKGSIQSVNADETLLLGVSAERDFALETGPRDPRFEATYTTTGPDGQPLTFAESKEVRLNARAEAAIPMEMFTVDLTTGEQRVIHRSTAWLNHLQFSPTDPQLIMFCHEGPWHRVDRIWSLRLGDEQPQLVHHRTMNMEIAGHEFFDVNGRVIWYDLQTPRGEVFWLARANPDGTQRQWFHVERDHWSVHFNMAPNGKFFAGDGGDEEMVAHATNGKWLYLFKPENIKDVAGISAPDAEHLIRPGVLRAEELVDMSRHDYRLEPNVIFTPDNKWVIFRSNMHGDVHTYMVEVARAKT
jgi:oligogalacturonide lyase